MDWDDELEEMIHGANSAGSGSGIDPMDISDPAIAYFLLSDDAQDEITGTDKKRMKCRVCGHRFTGEIYDRCPKCDSLDTEEFTDEKAPEYGRQGDVSKWGISRHPKRFLRAQWPPRLPGKPMVLALLTLPPRGFPAGTD